MPTLKIDNLDQMNFRAFVGARSNGKYRGKGKTLQGIQTAIKKAAKSKYGLKAK